MKKFKIISIILILFSIYSFNKSTPKSFLVNSQVEDSLPNDFYFIINSGGNDSYNSKNSTFSRKYLEDDKTVKIELTKEEKEKIYSFMEEVQFLKMPNKFEPKESVILITDPGHIKSILIYSNGKQKVVSYDTGYTSEKNKKRAENFFRLYDMIWNILRNKNEVINFPESDFHYK
ncbi:hypothetical protein [Flavobacterium sp. WC2509]|uniref:hypothetical protein n=1 Tax=Flavobacterium sp. WC2509 TaxID=3461406 RepID=UPI004043FC0D